MLLVLFLLSEQEISHHIALNCFHFFLIILVKVVALLLYVATIVW